MLYLLIQSLPPHIFTLFPYTTLFRSVQPAGRAPAAVDGAGPVATVVPSGGELAQGQLGVVDRAPQVGVQIAHAPGRGGHARPPHRDAGQPLQDRKSTRLNSSHVAISYAVFCLKKKKE